MLNVCEKQLIYFFSLFTYCLTITIYYTYLHCGILLLLFHPPTLWVVIATGIRVTNYLEINSQN